MVQLANILYGSEGLALTLPAPVPHVTQTNEVLLWIKPELKFTVWANIIFIRQNQDYDNDVLQVR